MSSATTRSILTFMILGAAGALSAACVAAGESETTNASASGIDGAPTSEEGEEGTPLDASAKDAGKTTKGKDAGAATPTSDGGAIPLADAGSPSGGVLPNGGRGYAIGVGTISAYDKSAYAHRDKLIGGGASTYNGISVIEMSVDFLTNEAKLVDTVINGGGTGYLTPGIYPCSNATSSAASVPLGSAWISLFDIPLSTTFVSEKGACSLEVVTAAPAVAGGKIRITGKVTGTLKDDKTGAVKPLHAEFDVVYDN